jgi:hypothetical protein
MNNVLVSNARLNSKGRCNGKVDIRSQVLGNTEYARADIGESKGVKRTKW